MRRRSIHSANVVERLEVRQVLTADWPQSVLVGPVFYGELAIPEVDETPGGSLPDHDHNASVPHATPLPAAWTSRGKLAAPAGGHTLHPLTAIPVLNSYPVSGISLYLDFNGHFEANWGSTRNITTPAFSQDNDASTFTDDELDAIAEIFSRVAEDFAPFAINVTTVEPADMSDGVGMRVAIGGRWEDWYKNPAGGVGFIDSFTSNLPNVVYAFSETLAVPQNIAEASSHEAGHSFGLSHQSRYDSAGRKADEYYSGNATGAPVMGLSYFEVRSRWWSGTSNSASTIQDDLAVLSRDENNFGYRPDDHGNDYAGATLLEFVANRASTTGVVEQMDDFDVFRFDVTAEDQYRIDYHAAEFGANLDAHLEIRMADDSLIQEESTFLDDSIAVGRTLGPGSYQVLIHSNGTYGSLGQYTLQVTLGNDPTLPPTTPGEFAGFFVSPTSATFSWIDALGETSYRLRATRQLGRRIETFTVDLAADTQTYTLVDHGVLDGWEFELDAVNSIGAATSDKIVPVELPLTAPLNVIVTPFSATAMAVQWDVVPSAFAYLVTITTAANPGTVLQDKFVDGTRNETVISGLQVGIEYLVTITARNSLGDVSQTPIAAEISELPDAEPLVVPKITTATAPQDFQVHLEWTEVPGATLFQIQQAGGKEWITVKVVAATVQEVDLFPDGDRARVRFRVVAGDGASTVTSRPVKFKRPRLTRT